MSAINAHTNDSESTAVLAPNNHRAGPLRLLVIGAGSRGNSYAKAVGTLGNAIIAGIAEPIKFKRERFGDKYIWRNGNRQDGQAFETWKDFLRYEEDCRRRQAAGEPTLPRIDGAFICTPDRTHVDIVEHLAPLGLHIMCEKPLATSLADCRRIHRAVTRAQDSGRPAVFSVGHVLRYSPHNMLLRQLLRDGAIGEIMSIEHTEPVGFWHFAHSYVRGHWRREAATAPSLLTKSGHDFDFLLWIMGVALGDGGAGRLPTWIASNGSLAYFHRSRKPAAAGPATNCLSCPYESQCIYSAKRIYVDHHLMAKEKLGWPTDIVEPEIEEIWKSSGKEAAKARLLARLAEDYDETTSPQTIDSRPWFGRCVYESANDVCDDQMVFFEWDVPFTDASVDRQDPDIGPGTKIASLHMVAFTEKQCERRGRIYGTRGEIEYDGTVIRDHDFATQETKEHYPVQEGGGHGGGDYGLTRQFVRAMHAVQNSGETIASAQEKYIGANINDMIRSHVLTFAAEDARKQRKQIQCSVWWKDNFDTDMP